MVENEIKRAQKRSSAESVIACVAATIFCFASPLARGSGEKTDPFGSVPHAVLEHGSACSRVLSEPVQPTFQVPRTAVYVNQFQTSNVIGHWKCLKTTDGVDFTSQPQKRTAWNSEHSTEYTFRIDGTFSVKTVNGGKTSQNSGRWWVEGEVLKLTLQQDIRTYRVLWLDANTFDMRWASEAAEEDWWRKFFGRGRYKDWQCSVHLAYDAYGCCWKRSEFLKDGGYVVFDTVSSPPRYVRCDSPEPDIPVANESPKATAETPVLNNPVTKEGMALFRMAFSPVNIVGHAYAQVEHCGAVGVVLSPILVVVAIPGGVMATCCDIVTGLGEMLTCQQFRSVSYPWQSFDYEASERWMGIAADTMDTTAKVANQTQEIATQIDSLQHGGEAASAQGGDKPSGQSSAANSGAQTSGYGSISGPTTLKSGSSATYKLRVGGKVVHADWSQGGTSISVYSAGDHGRAMAGNPPIKKGKFKTGVRATYNGKSYSKTIYIQK